MLARLATHFPPSHAFHAARIHRRCAPSTRISIARHARAQPQPHRPVTDAMARLVACATAALSLAAGAAARSTPPSTGVAEAVSHAMTPIRVRVRVELDSGAARAVRGLAGVAARGGALAGRRGETCVPRP